LAGDKLEARSAGSHPVGEVHPLSLKYLQEANIPTDGLRSQSWSEFEGWAPDVVVTVCDAAAGETCPVWFGKALRIHWALSDPSKVEGTEDEKADAFRACIHIIEDRVKGFAEVAVLPTVAERAEKLKALGATIVGKPPS